MLSKCPLLNKDRVNLDFLLSDVSIRPGSLHRILICTYTPTVLIDLDIYRVAAFLLF